jgi:hypothetical protein
LNEAQQEYERLRQTDQLTIDEAQRARIAALARDFPRLWQDPKTPDRERKRMVRLLLEDVTLLKGEQIQVHVRFKGGVLKSLSLPPPVSAPYLRKTPADVVAEVDRLLDQHTDREIVAILNEKGLRSGMGRPFTVMTIINIRRHYGLRDRCQRMRDLGLLTIQQIAERLGIAASAVKDWRDRGLLRGHPYNDKGQCLYEPPAGDLPGKHKRKRAYLVAKGNVRASAKGVQCEA